jgi:uncharacterized protein YhaN
MKIENIHIDGFGVWNDKDLGPLDPGLNVFFGPNETGKSTLMGFIRSMFFGFEKRGSPRRYEPTKGGNHGGWLDLLVGDTRLRLERKQGRHVRGSVTLYAGDATNDDSALDRLLGGTTKTLYHNVFAFGLEELEHFHTLQDNEVATHISGAGLGIGAARWTTVQKDLEDRQSALFLARGQNSTINVAFKELESVREDLERTEHQPQDYLAAHEARSRLAAELAVLEEKVAELTRKINYYAKRLKDRPYLERRSKIEARLRELPSVDQFPEGGVERLNLLSEQRGNLAAERVRAEREAATRRQRRVQLRNDPEDYARRLQTTEALRTLMPRMEASRRVYTACTERLDAVLQGRQTLESALVGVRAPSWPAFVAFICILLFGSGSLAFMGQNYAAYGLGFVAAAALFWYRNRVRRTNALSSQLAECITKLDVCKRELRKTESEAREIESEVRKLTGKTDVTQAEIDQRLASLEELSKINDEARSLDEDAARSEIELQRIKKQAEETARNIAALLMEASAANEQQFLANAEIYKQRRELIQEREKLPIEIPETGVLFDTGPDEQQVFESAQKELSDLEHRLVQARQDTGRVEERITMMEKSEERSRALSRQETILARIDEAAEQWAVLTLCRALLDETRKIYETERQPEVLRQASSFFTVMTEGCYIRIIAPLDGGEIQVERRDGVRLSPQVLSRGTAEQLYLSMRLALVREYANHVDPLPVVFDDIFVNFDSRRSRTTFKAIRELSSTHQVLLFTCHPHLVKQVEEIVPAAKLFPLQ